MAKADLTAQRLRELVQYNPDTGHFYRLPGGTALPGVNALGYRKASIGGTEYQLHRVAWLYMTGQWPTSLIDHINGDRADNRWSNLREASRHVNQQNRRAANKNSKSGLLGASWSKDKRKWVARIYLSGYYKCLGYFGTAEEAHAAYIAAKRKYHAGCTI